MQYIFPFAGKIKLAMFVMLLFILGSFDSYAQLSGDKYIPDDYATIAAAVTALNTDGVGSGGVTFKVAAGHTEAITSPILLTATGTASNPIIFQKNGSGDNPLVNRTDAGSLSTSTLGGQGDAVIIIQGGDYITFDGIDVSAGNQGIEYGYYLRKAGVTDGCKNITIKNATITMTKGTSAYVVGIYSSNNDASSVTSSATGITVTSEGGRNENVTIIGNTIQNVHAGIVLRGFNHTTSPYNFYDQNFVVGQSGAGNTIQNFGGGSATTSYGVYLIYHNNSNISYNTINNTSGGGSAFSSTGYGIFHSTATNGNGTYNNNTITLSSTTGQLRAISSGTLGVSTLIANNNTITLNQASTSEASGIYFGSLSAGSTYEMKDNTFSYGTFASTLSSYIMYGSNSANNVTVTGNQTSGTITKTGTSGTFYGYYNFGSPSGGTATLSNNNISNISLTGTSAFYGLYYATTVSQGKTIANNTVSNITNGSGTSYGIFTNYDGANSDINDNTVYNITGTGTLYGMQIGGGSSSGAFNCFNNLIYNISSSGSSTVYGLSLQGTTGTDLKAYKNKIYNIENTSTSGSAYGLHYSAGTTFLAYNNLIGNITAPNVNLATEPVRGINIASTTTSSTVELYYNTVYLNASSAGGNFGSAALYVSTNATATTAALTMKNNIFVNTSTANGTGKTSAYRRSNATLTNYATGSNNNLFYAGSPSANNLIYYDGTNSDQTLAEFKARVSTRESNSVTENAPFLSTTGSSANFLHIDPSVETQIESGGQPITGITTDYDGDTRNATTPDIGADEGTFTILDLTAPNISYTALGNSSSITNRTVTGVNITDPSDVNTDPGSAPRIYYKKSTDDNSEEGWKYVETEDTESPFSFVIDYSLLNDGSVSIGDVIQYFVAAVDKSTSQNVGIFAGTPNQALTSINLGGDDFPVTGMYSYEIVPAPLAGDYTVGAEEFNRITGKNIYFEKNVTKVTKEIEVELPVEKGDLSGVVRTEKQIIEVEEITWTPMQNGAVYKGDLYVKKSESPNYNYPSGVEGVYATITAAVTDLNFRGVSAPVRFLLTDATYSVGETFPIVIDITSADLPTATNTVTIRPQASVTSTITGSSSTSIFKLNGADYIIIDGSNSGGSDRSLTITNTNTGTSSSVVWIGSKSASNGATNNTVKNTIVIGQGPTSTLGAVVISSGTTVGGTAEAQNNNNTITNNEIKKAQYGIHVVGPTGNESGLVITNNLVGSTVSDDKIGLRGIGIQNQQNVNVSNNSIFGVVRTSGDNNGAGLFVGGTISGGSINANKLWDIKNTNTGGWAMSGILLNSSTASTNLTISNNSVADVTGYGYASNWTDNGHGIRINNGGGYNLYFNSVNMGTNQTAAGNSSALYIPGTGTGLNIVNNVFRNAITTGTRYSVYTSATASIFNTMNYNDYHSSGDVGFLTTARPTLANWQTATGKDVNSIAVDPQFQTSTDLRPSLESPILGAGTNISGITTDLLGVTRNGSTPSIGAYEEGIDATGPVINYTSLTNTNSTANRTLSGVTITDVSGIDWTNAPRIYFKKSTDNNVFGGNTSTDNGWKWTATTTGSSPASFTIDYSIINGGSVNVGDIVQYFVVAQDLFGTPNVSSNPSAGFVGTSVSSITSAPTTPSSYTIVGLPLSGDYTVGTSEFNRITGRNIYFQKSVVKVMKEVEIFADNSDVRNSNVSREELEKMTPDASLAIQSTKVMMEVEDVKWVPMENGQVYEGQLYVKKSENPGYNYPEGIEGVYSTITEAINDVNSRGVSGPVRFLLTDANYTTETLPIIINVSSESMPTETNTITIKPNTDVTSSITGASPSGQVFDIRTNHVIIDGSNSNGGTTRDLTITNTSATSPQVVRIASVGENTRTNVTLKNCNIINGSTTSSAVVLLSSAGVAGYYSNITVQNNSVQKAYIGIYGNAVVSSGNGNGTLITQNDVNATGANASRLVGIYIQGFNGATVSNNNVGNFTNANAENPRGIWFATGTVNSTITGNTVSSIATTNTSTYSPVGILVTSGVANSNVTVTQNTVSGITTIGSGTASGIAVSGATQGVNVTRNTVFNVRNTHTLGWGCNGIWLSSTYDSSANCNVINNLVYDIAAYGYAGGGSGDNGYGIIVTSGRGYNIFYNSVNMNTNQLTGSGYPAAFNVTSGVTIENALDVRNNIFANSMTLGTQRYSVYSGAAASVYSNINYNDYYFTGANLGFLGSNQANLEAWQTATGKDGNSISANPEFFAETDLRPDDYLSPVINAGTPITGYTTDFNGETRSGSTPTIGAYENSARKTFTGDGNLNDAGNWVGGLPSSGSHVSIRGNCVIPDKTNNTFFGTLGDFKVQTGGSLNMTTFQFPGSRELINNGYVQTQSKVTDPLPPNTNYGGTVEYNGVSKYIASNSTYNNLILSGTAAKAMTGDVTVNGVFTMDGTETLTGMQVKVNDNTLTINGSVNFVGLTKIGTTLGSSLVLGESVALREGLLPKNYISEETIRAHAEEYGDAEDNLVVTNEEDAEDAESLTANETPIVVEKRVRDNNTPEAVFELPAMKLGNLTVNRTDGVKMLGSITVDGTLSLLKGTFDFDAFKLTVNGAVNKTTGNWSSDGVNAAIIIGGTGETPVDVYAVNLKALTVNRPSGITLRGAVGVATKATLNGLVAISGGSLVGGEKTQILVGGSGSAVLIPPCSVMAVVVDRDGGATLNSGTLNIAKKLYLTNGTFTVNPAATLALAMKTAIYRTSGTLSGTYTPDATVGLVYQGGSHINMGSEVPVGADVVMLTMGNTGGLTLNSNMSLNAALSITGGNFDIKNNTLTLGATKGSITETSGELISSTSNGLVVKEYNWKMMNDPTNVAGLGITVSSPKKLGLSTVTRGFTPLVVGEGDLGISRWYKIEPTVNTALNATIFFRYKDSELGEINEDDLALWLSTDDGASWTNIGGSVNTGANTISVSGVNQVGLITAASTFAMSASRNINVISFDASVSKKTVTFEVLTQDVTGDLFIEKLTTKEGETDSWTTIGQAEMVKTFEKENPDGNQVSTVQSFTFVENSVEKGIYQYRLKNVDSRGRVKYSENTIEVEVEGIPTEYALMQNYPNPFNPTTRIKYQLPLDGKVVIELYSVTGEKVADLVNSELTAGYYTLDVNAASLNLTSGVYIYRIVANNLETGDKFVSVKKMMLIK